MRTKREAATRFSLARDPEYSKRSGNPTSSPAIDLHACGMCDRNIKPSLEVDTFNEILSSTDALNEARYGELVERLLKPNLRRDIRL